MTEPTAAALAYGFSEDKLEFKHMLIFDFGGETFDVTILGIGANTIWVVILRLNVAPSIDVANCTFIGACNIRNWSHYFFRNMKLKSILTFAFQQFDHIAPIDH